MKSDRIPQREWAIEITQEDGRLVSSIKEKLESVSLPQCIYRVSETFLRGNEEKYFPMLVSIGPFHHKDKKFQGLEDQKWGYLNTLISRRPTLDASKLEHKENQEASELKHKANSEAILDSCVKALRKLEYRARKCYKEEIDMASNEFVKMMLVDGCFIIELFLKSSIKGLRRRDDYFFTAYERSFRLRCDILLLENQIPFFVIQQLFDLVPLPKQCTHSLAQLALHFFRKVIPGDLHVLQQKSSQEFNHLLDLIHQCYLPIYPELQAIGKERNLRSATNLQKGGINFKRVINDHQSLLDIKFFKGVLEIPPLTINNYTEILLRNLVAMEHPYHNCMQNVTSYTFLMKSLIQSKQDVKLLFQRNIIVGGLYKEEEIFDLFRKIHSEVNVKEFYYRGLCDQVNEYTKSIKRGSWKEKMNYIYSRTPFGFVGFIIAIFLLVLTFTGILFSALSFSLHHHF